MKEQEEGINKERKLSHKLERKLEIEGNRIKDEERKQEKRKNRSK